MTEERRELPDAKLPLVVQPQTCGRQNRPPARIEARPPLTPGDVRAIVEQFLAHTARGEVSDEHGRPGRPVGEDRDPTGGGRGPRLAAGAGAARAAGAPDARRAAGVGGGGAGLRTWRRCAGRPGTPHRPEYRRWSRRRGRRPRPAGLAAAGGLAGGRGAARDGETQREVPIGVSNRHLHVSERISRRCSAPGRLPRSSAHHAAGAVRRDGDGGGGRAGGRSTACASWGRRAGDAAGAVAGRLPGAGHQAPVRVRAGWRARRAV